MRKIKKPKVGEYILATRWSDKDPRDPWFVGIVDCVCECKDGDITATIIGDKTNRRWRKFFRITREEGAEWLRKHGAT